MKSLLSLTWIRSLKLRLRSALTSRLRSMLKLFLASAAFTLSVVSTDSNQVWAQSKSQTIKQQIQTLQQSNQRWIQIDLSEQRLTAWVGGKSVYAIIVSTGKKSTPTRTGVFQIQSKHKSTRMRGRDYNVPNVPHVMYYSGNYGIHGAYWHRRFGTPVSHGCVNLAPNHAKWLFNWAAIGTPVVVNR